MLCALSAGHRSRRSSPASSKVVNNQMIFCRLVSEGRDQKYDESVRGELLSDRKPESQGKEVDIIQIMADFCRFKFHCYYKPISGRCKISSQPLDVTVDRVLTHRYLLY
jgi:hypothetical protein